MVPYSSHTHLPDPVTVCVGRPQLHCESKSVRQARSCPYAQAALNVLSILNKY